MPPHGDKDRSAAEDIPRALIVIFIQHRPFKGFVVHLALHLRRIRSLDLLPGTLHDFLVVGDGFLAAETLHLFLYGFNQVNGYFLEFFALACAVIFSIFERGKELFFVGVQFFREG